MCNVNLILYKAIAIVSSVTSVTIVTIVAIVTTVTIVTSNMSIWLYKKCVLLTKLF